LGRGKGRDKVREMEGRGGKGKKGGRGEERKQERGREYECCHLLNPTLATDSKAIHFFQFNFVLPSSSLHLPYFVPLFPLPFPILRSRGPKLQPRVCRVKVGFNR